MMQEGGNNRERQKKIRPRLSFLILNEPVEEHYL